MEVKAYLKRIGYDIPVQPDVETLIGLHRAHLFTVPFENLDIQLGKPIQLTEWALWKKLIVHKRGGFCYELNGIFAWLLKQIGYEVTYLNGRVYNSHKRRGREFDHLTLLVEIPNQSARWLADVGFGNSFVEPLSLEFDCEQSQGSRAYRLEQVEEGIDLWERNDTGDWSRQYFFDLLPRVFPSDYEAACLYHQTSPQSSFTHDRVITRATPEGRITLSGKNLMITMKNKRIKQQLKSDTEFQKLLVEYFGFEF